MSSSKRIPKARQASCHNETMFEGFHVISFSSLNRIVGNIKEAKTTSERINVHRQSFGGVKNVFTSHKKAFISLNQ